MGKAEELVLGDNRANENIIDSSILKHVITAGVKVEVETLSNPKIFNMAITMLKGKQAELICHRAVFMDTELQIRPGSCHLLQNLHWLVSRYQVAEMLLGRPGLQSVGLNTLDLQAATPDRISGHMDVEILADTFNPQKAGKVSRILERVFQEDGGETRATATKIQKIGLI